MMLLNSGVPDDELDCGIAEVFLVNTQRHCRLSFMTVPKRRLSRRKLTTLLPAAGIPTQRPAAGQDLIVVCGDDGGDVLTGLLDQVRRGKVSLIRPGEN